MNTPDPARDEDALAYVLGIGPETERAAFARAMSADPALAALVADWEERLAPLAGALPEMPPSPGLLASIEAALDRSGRTATVDAGSFGSARDLGRLRRSRNMWRSAAAGAAALAAALAIYISVERRTGPLTKGVLVAAVNRSGELPALIVRVDQEAGTVQVRALAAEAPSDRSLELWSVVSGRPPRSLGLVAGPRTVIPIGERGGDLGDGITVAVTLEPKGGSPTGLPLGPVVYSGKLVVENP